MDQVLIPYSMPGGEFLIRPQDPEQVFGRVAGGLAWPAHGNRGFLVVLAEEARTDPAFNVKHVHLVYEPSEEEGSLIHLDNLLRAALRAMRACSAGRWFAPRLEKSAQLVRFNREQAQLRQPQVRPVQPEANPSFEHYASLVRSRIHERKTLHFGKSAIPAKLSLLPSDCSAEQFEDHPEITALFFALAGLELISSSGRSSSDIQGTAPADRTGGY